MAGFDVYVFELDGRYVFKQFLDSSEVFEALSEHYVSDEYRFELPKEAFDTVAETLRDHGYQLTMVDDPEPFVVVIGQYEKHAEILKESVANWNRREHEFFLMRSPAAVEQALNRGATPVAETEFEAGI